MIKAIVAAALFLIGITVFLEKCHAPVPVQQTTTTAPVEAPTVVVVPQQSTIPIPEPTPVIQPTVPVVKKPIPVMKKKPHPVTRSAHNRDANPKPKPIKRCNFTLECM